MKQKLVVFFDDECGMCHSCIRIAYEHDKNNCFYFAPINGKTSAQYLSNWRKLHPNVDSIVLVEGDGQISYYSKAVFIILWHLGFPYSVLGILHFLPKPLLYPCDLVYRLIAYLRPKSCPLGKKPPKDERFLP